eukprot:gene11460-biopygen8112
MAQTMLLSMGGHVAQVGHNAAFVMSRSGGRGPRALGGRCTVAANTPRLSKEHQSLSCRCGIIRIANEPRLLIETALHQIFVPRISESSTPIRCC